MKKIKLMLLSLALLAIIGGALAFKARTTFLYCTAAVIGFQQSCGIPLQTCPNLVFRSTNAPGFQEFVCYTVPQIFTTGPYPEDAVAGCAINTDDWQNGRYGTTTLTCVQTPRVLKADF